MTRPTLAQRAAAAALGRYLRFALSTIRWRVDGEAMLAPFVEDRAVVAAFWHQRLPLMPAVWLRVRRANPGRAGAVLVSRHRDGRFIGRILDRFGLSVAHGSSTRADKPGQRGGASAFRGLLSALERGEAVMITPDGPRGPPRVAAPGVAALAAQAQVPVLPLAAQCRPRLALKSWDNMVLPLPFGRGVLVCGAPLEVSEDAPGVALLRISAAIDVVTARADALCDAPAPETRRRPLPRRARG